MSNFDPSKFIDGDIIEKQAAKHAAATARLDAARKAMADAQKARGLATAASDAAITGQSDDCPHAASEALDAASTRLSVAQRVLTGCEVAHQKATDGIRIASGMASKPLMIHGIRRRVEAAKKYDAAQKLLAEADAEHVAGEGIIALAFQNGTPRPFGSDSHPRRLVTEVAERKLWADSGIDVESGIHPWDVGEY